MSPMHKSNRRVIDRSSKEGKDFLFVNLVHISQKKEGKVPMRVYG